MASVSVTKLRNASGSSNSSGPGSRVSSVTVRPVRSSSASFTPLATYLSLRSLQVSEDTELPRIEIINNYGEDSNELPPGTKIITQPMTSVGGWTNKFHEVQTRRPSTKSSEDLSINNIVRRLQQTK